MTGNEFIFSNKLTPRLTRHVAFWLVFYLQTVLVTTQMSGFADFFRFRSYTYALISAALLLPVCILSVYTSLLILFPLFRQKKYVLFGIALFFFVGINCLMVWGFYVYTRPYTCVGCGGASRFEIVNTIASLGINVASFLGIIALGIKFTKSWYLQQINNRKLTRQKISNELKLLKARIQPEFLFETLQALHSKIESDKQQAAEMLLKFSELLSYTLYECDEDFIDAERVLLITKEFIALEKSMMKTSISGRFTHENISNKYIPSFAVLPLLQHCVYITGKHKAEVKSVAIEVSAEKNWFHCITHVQTDNLANIRQEYADVIDMFRNRLESLYYTKYSLDVSESGQIFSIKLSLMLSDILTTEKTNKIPDTVYEIMPA